MKTFSTPEIEVHHFTVADIVTTSNPNEFPVEPFSGYNPNELTIVDMS